MNLSTEEREEVATELKRFASDLNLSDDQKEKLHGALTEAREKIAEYMQQNPNTTKADVISKVVANRDAIRQRVVNFLSPEQLREVGRRKSQSQGLPGPEDRSLRLCGKFAPRTFHISRLLSESWNLARSWRRSRVALRCVRQVVYVLHE